MFSIEPAKTSDCNDCARLLVEQLAEHATEVSVDHLTRVLEDVVREHSNGFLILARDNGQIIGVAYIATILSAEHCGLVGWLEELYVTPSYRSRGVGTALVNAVLDRAHKVGMVAIDLEVDASHRRVEALYQRLGFRPLERSRWVRKLT